MDINVSFDNQYRLVDNTDIGTIRVLMLRGEQGEPGTTNYAEATNKPRINGYEIVGSKTAGQYGLATLTDLSEVAGDIPEATSELQNDSGFITASDIPTIPTKTSDLQNDSGFITSADVPTKTSELQNDSGFITTASIPTKTSDLVNDSGFIDASAIGNALYPVGSIYLSVTNTNPSTYFGGTWEQIKDTFLLSAGDTYTAGDTGGEATHTLTVDEIPSHTHTVTDNVNMSFGTSINLPSSGTGLVLKHKDTYTGNKGGGQAHNNMPPYLVVYMWKRTA